MYQKQMYVILATAQGNLNYKELVPIMVSMCQIKDF